MSRRPTAKAGIIGAIGGVLVAVGTTAQAGWLYVLAAGVLGLAVSGLLASQRVSAAEITRSLPAGARPRVGDAVDVTLQVANRSSRRLPVMRIEDVFPAFEDVAVACESVPAGESAALELERVALLRGVFEKGHVAVTIAAPFGLARSTRDRDVTSRIVVHPRWSRLDAFPLPDTPAATADEALAVARSGTGEVFAGVREYRPGDPQRWVHWRSTARTGRLVVREHEEPARSPVVLVVAGDPPDAAHPEWERLVATAASAGVFALERGRNVNCAGASHFGEFLENVTQLQLLDWCAGLAVPVTTPVEAVAGAFRRWGRRCSFVVLTPRRELAEEALRLAESRRAGVRMVVGEADAEGLPA